MAVPIANILHQETIRRLAGDGAFDRGKVYFHEGRVVDLVRKDGSVQAKVRGTEAYDVRIWMKDESLAYACNCPHGQEQAFCKHAVAVALAFTGGVPRAKPVEPVIKPSLADTLRALSHEELVVVLLEAALDDQPFKERLVRRLSQR